MKSYKCSIVKKKSLLNLTYKYKYKNSNLNILKNLAVYQDCDQGGFIPEIQLSRKTSIKILQEKII